MLAEECVALAIRGRQSPEWLTGPEAARLLECTPAGNLPREAAQREVAKALEALQAERPRLEALARQRAAELLQDHERVRQATGRRGRRPAPGAGLPARGRGRRLRAAARRGLRRAGT
jgi:pyruvate/2-oxoglutarate dehydrogenase complex dihydrolipoamide acyltransferase (E2) component